jgi:hypothetical protein
MKSWKSQDMSFILYPQREAIHERPNFELFKKIDGVMDSAFKR